MIFRQLLSGINGGKVLDVGCGTGRFIEILADSLALFESITGVDIEEEYLAEAGKKFPGAQFSFQRVGPGDLPYRDDTFDLVAISMALHHIEDPGQTLGEMLRVVKKDGYMLVNEIHQNVLSDDQASHMRYHHLRSEIDRALGISHQHTFHREDLISLVSGLGLNELQIHEFIPDSDESDREESYREYSGKMDRWLEGLADHPRREEFAEKVQQVKSWIRKHGISRPPQMVFLGRK